MSNRAAKIAGPMLAKRDAHGKSKIPATQLEVRDALETAKVHPAVIREWTNEATRRNRNPSEPRRGIGYAPIAWVRAYVKRFRARKAQRRARKITRRAA